MMMDERPETDADQDGDPDEAGAKPLKGADNLGSTQRAGGGDTRRTVDGGGDTR